MWAAALKALPALGGLTGGGGGSTKISNSVSAASSAAVNPAISVSVGGGVNANPSGYAGAEAPSTALAYGEEYPSGLPSLGLGMGTSPGAATYTPSPAIQTGTDGAGDLLSNPLVWVGAAAAAFFLLKG